MKSVLVRAQKEIKSMEEKASIILKEYSHEENDGRNMNISNAFHEVSEGNEEQIIANGSKATLVIYSVRKPG